MPAEPERDPQSGEDGLRSWFRRYGWLVAAGAVALVVLLASWPLVSNAGLPWYDGRPEAVVAQPPTPVPAPATTEAPTAAPTENAAPPAPKRTKAPPRKPSTAAPTAPATTSAPVLLGPSNDNGLQLMLMTYCYTQRGMREAQLRSGTNPAEDNWECRTRNRRELINMRAACQWRYGTDAVARYSDPANAYTWRCYRD
ncbi:hypothetical protein [Rhizomonospora bruguierae]|uniref:hypothetical protein n=1 Tax=Rhizomonospora bruguierae TaxID=1581705 RepID=UPI001BCC561D|nr:hypothetical protein [Micromonospora sp. NBRC 107566]